MYLQGREDKGGFTFQAALHHDGRIVFGYKEVSERSRRDGWVLGSSFSNYLWRTCNVPATGLSVGNTAVNERAIGLTLVEM